jgi:hypothetical protein
VIHDLVACLAKMLLQVFAEFETGVIGRDMDAHGFSLEADADSDASAVGGVYWEIGGGFVLVRPAT